MTGKTIRRTFTNFETSNNLVTGGNEERRQSGEFEKSFANSEHSLLPPDLKFSSQNKCQTVAIKPKKDKEKEKSPKKRIVKVLRRKTTRVKKSSDPEKYRGFLAHLNKIKTQKKENIEELDKRTQKRIEKILKLESSKRFYICDFITFWLDYYARFAYPFLFFMYLVFIFTQITENIYIIVGTLCLEVIIVLSLVFWIYLNWKMKISKKFKRRNKQDDD